MNMQNIAFILDDSVLFHHVGVRRYIISLSKALNQEFDVRIFKVEYEPTNCKPYFTELFIEDQFAKDNGFSTNYLVGNNKNEILQEINNVFADKVIKNEQNNGFYACSYGTELPCDLDLIIVGAPWVFKGGLDLSAKEGVYCIAYDAIPNDYAVNTPEDKCLQDFAYKHLFAYEAFLSKYNGLLAISKETARQVGKLFPKFENKIFIIPSFLPTGFENVAKTKIDRINKEKVILLASPLDVRKGLKILPQYINNLSFDKLIIFGAPRCSYQDAHNFFSEISMNKITWWSKVNFNKQIELYEAANIIIFPSLNEGLGLPVLESYSCGRPVYVSNTSPLNELVEKEFILSNNINDTFPKLQSTLDSTIEDEKYKSIAIERWGALHVVNFIKKLVMVS